MSEKNNQDWGTRMLLQELGGKRLSRRVRDRAVAMVRQTGKFSRSSSKPTAK